KANDAEQPLSVSLFSPSHFAQNTLDYLQVATTPWQVQGPHASLLLLLAAVVCSLIAFRLLHDVIKRRLARDTLQIALFIVGILLLHVVLSFSYFWGKPHHAISARLFIWLDTFVAFTAAWA